jgi:hypothetical protein
MWRAALRATPVLAIWTALLPALLLARLVAGAAAEDERRAGVEPSRPDLQLIVEAPPGLAERAAAIIDDDPRAWASLGRLVGLADPGPPVRVVLAPEGSELAAGAPPWVAGYAWPALGTVVLLPERTPTYPAGSFREVLRHELAHVLIARASAGRELPRWFHEGLAMVAAGTWGLEDRTRLTLALLRGEPVPLARLDALFGGGRGEVTRAYALAGSFVSELLARHGPDTAAEILSGVRRGRSFADAFAAATGTSLAAAEEAFARRRSFWNRWLPILSSSAALWAGVTVLALWAIGRRRARDAAVRRRWEEEERWGETP